jgi:release factor glutamine methyltransferase
MLGPQVAQDHPPREGRQGIGEETIKNSGDADWTIIKLIGWATSYLKSHGIDSPRMTGEILLAHALNLQRIDLYLKYDQPLMAEELQRFKALIKRRIGREPVAYILGVKEFWSLEFQVNPSVLIPRPETECLVEKALELLAERQVPPPQCILDLGTGSGAIVTALASQQPQQVYFASDRHRSAVEIARDNARRHGCAARIHFFAGDWLSCLSRAKAGFDMIVSNPPYIARSLIDGLQPEISRFEPRTALDGAADGLACYQTIIGAAGDYLKTAGVLIMEIGHDQREAVRRIAERSGCFEAFDCTQDYSGNDRVVWMRKKG